MDDARASHLRFGQWKNVPLRLVPSDYLHWLLTLEDLWPATQRAVDAELAHRDRLRLHLEVIESCSLRQARAAQAARHEADRQAPTTPEESMEGLFPR